MPLLDPNRLPDFTQRYYDNPSARLVGRNRAHESFYIDIVRFFGDGTISPADIKIKYNPRPYQITDARIKEFALEIEKRLRAEGRLYDGPLAMKIADFRPHDHQPSITVQPTEYGRFAGSCFALDLEHDLFANHGGTLREYCKQTCPSNSIADNPLAACLGVCGMVLLDNQSTPALLRVKRSGKLASLESSFGPSVSGGVDYSEKYNNLYDLLQSALAQEIQEEIGLHRGEYTIIPLACAREILRGEHHQVFCLIRIDLDRDKLVRRLNGITGPSCEYESFDFIKMNRDNTLDRDAIESMNLEGRMNYYLLEEYFAL